MGHYPNEWDLNLNGDTFNALKSDFNMVLRKTLTNMETKSSEAAEVTIKLKISLKKETSSSSGYIPREVVIPKFDHKVSSVMQIKDALTGSLGGNYELVWDTDRGEFIMREIVNGQQSIFDAQYENVYDPNDDQRPEDEERGLVELPGNEPLMLPETTSGELELEGARQSCMEGFADEDELSLDGGDADEYKYEEPKMEEQNNA